MEFRTIGTASVCCRILMCIQCRKNEIAWYRENQREERKGKKDEKHTSSPIFNLLDIIASTVSSQTRICSRILWPCALTCSHLTKNHISAQPNDNAGFFRVSGSCLISFCNSYAKPSGYSFLSQFSMFYVYKRRTCSAFPFKSGNKSEIGNGLVATKFSWICNWMSSYL